MKPKPINWVASLKEWHLSAVTLAFFTLVWFAFANSSAQTKNAKRILSLRVNDEPEGSRVTVVSNLALGDYEAYRRGDRFHVKIPASEFATSESHFRGKGFDDVQVQKNGDSVVISFKLQPGASARVDQRFNRLQVVFATVAGSDAGAASKSRGLQSGPSPRDENSRRFSSQTAGYSSSQQNRARSRDVPVALAPNSPGGVVRDSRSETPGSDNSSGQRGASAGTKTDIGNAGSSVPSPDANTSTYSPSDNTANSRSTSGLIDQSTASTPGANATESRALSPVLKRTGSSFGQWLSLHWLQARILLLTLVSAVLLIAATVWRRRHTSPSVRRWKGEKVGPTQSATVDEEAAIVDSSLPMLQDTVLGNTPQQHVEVTAQTKPTLHLTSPQSATQEILVKSTEAESISHLPEVKEVIEEPPFSHSPQFERTDHEIKKLLAGQEYDANLIDAPDSATRQLVAVSLLTALSGRTLEQHEPARKAFVDHGYFDETTRDLRTADSPAERAAAARKLGIVGDNLGTAHLVASLYDTVPEVRRAAVESLGQIGDPAAISPLNDLLARETSGLLPEATIRNAINSITLKEFKRKSTHDKRALRVVEKPVELNSRVEANAAFIRFMDTIQRLEFETESLASVAPPPSALPSVTLPENKRSITNEEEQLHLEEQALRRAAEDLEVRRMAAEAARQKAEGEARLKAEREAQARTKIEARIRAENEAHRRAEEEAARIKSEGEARIRAEQEEQARAAEEAHIRAEEEARFRLEAEALRRAAEELARKRVDAEIARKRVEQEGRRRAEEETSRLIPEESQYNDDEEVRRQVEVEMRGPVEDKARHLTEQDMQKRVQNEPRRPAVEELRRVFEHEALRPVEEERLLREADVRRQSVEQGLRIEQEALIKAADEVASRRREVEHARRIAEEEERKRIEEDRQRLEVEAHRAEEERQRFEEACRRATEEQRRIEEESRRQAEEEEQHLSELEAVRKKAQDHARQRAEIEQRIRSEIQALHKAEEEQRQRIETETRRRTEAEARLREEQALSRVEEQSCLKVEEEARLAQESRIMGEPETRLRVDEEPVVGKPALNDYSWADLNVRQDEITETASAIHESQPARETVVNNPGPTEEPAKEIDVVRSENGLAPIGGDSDISSELLNKLTSDSSAERSEALNDLARLGGEDAFRFINRSFDDQSADVRNAAARALYDLQSDRAATFTRALREGTPDRRRRIGAALAASGLASNAIANLTGESREKTYDGFSLLFLMAKAGEVLPLLRAIEEFPSVEVRLAVVKLLALSGQPEIVPAFRRLAVRGSLPSEVRAALMEAIYQISSQTRETPAA
jgi:HEAT repeat protein